jgi:hypothetical protein
VKELRIVCSRPPSSHPSAFIEIEDETGKSIDVGDWRQREDDDYWELVVIVDTLR